jgi:hypothetical protein
MWAPVVKFFIQVRSLVSIVSGHGVQQYIHMEGDRGNTLWLSKESVYKQHIGATLAPLL